MTRYEAIRRADAKATAYGLTYLAVERTDHPRVAGVYYYVIAADDKRLYTPGETVIHVARPAGVAS